MAEQARNLLIESMRWIDNPWIAVGAGCALLLALIAMAVILCVRLKRKAARARGDLEAERERLAEIEGVSRRVNALEARLGELDEKLVPPAAGISLPDSVHLNRRGQILKLHRAGHSAPQIASSLRVSQGEVQLTLKLHTLFGRKREEKSAADWPLIAEKIRDTNTRGLLVKEAG
jgi:hypothetical protein